jgi:predicted cupin superfamily sugar epimerase
MAMPKAADIITRLRLTPHPEGGHYRETWRAPAQPGERASGTAIYYLLSAGERSHWHKVDAAEIWHWYAGAPLELRLSAETGQVTAPFNWATGWKAASRHSWSFPPTIGKAQQASANGAWLAARFHPV